MSNIFSTLGAAVKTKIDGAVSSINSDISDLQTDLTNEISRAGAAEAANTAAIQSNDSDISTLQSSVASNDSDISTLQSAVTSNDTDISTLQSAVTSNDTDISTLQSSVSTNATAISDEETRATAAEQANATAITSEAATARAAEQANATAISSEAATARAAEQANAAAIASNDSDISDLNTQAGSLAADGNSASFSGDVSCANAVIAGNLTVSGTTTTVDTTNLEIKDSIMNVSKGASAGANASNDGGFIVERGSSESNVGFVWDEGADRFRAVSTSATAATSDIDAADSSMSYVEMQVSDLYLGTDNLGSITDFTSALNA